MSTMLASTLLCVDEVIYIDHNLLVLLVLFVQLRLHLEDLCHLVPMTPEIEVFYRVV